MQGGNHSRQEIMRVWDLSTNKSLTALLIPQGSPVGPNPLGTWIKDERDPVF